MAVWLYTVARSKWLWQIFHQDSDTRQHRLHNPQLSSGPPARQLMLIV